MVSRQDAWVPDSPRRMTNECGTPAKMGLIASPKTVKHPGTPWELTIDDKVVENLLAIYMPGTS